MKHDEAKRRSYWAAQLDEAHDFMMRIMDYPVEECGERLVSLTEAAKAAGVDVRFSDRPHVKGLPRIFVLREGLIDRFVDTARRMNDRGWAMRVEDAFRSRAMQKGIGLEPYIFDVVLRKVMWELDGQTPDPDFLFKRLLSLAAQIPKTATHMSGSAIDISVHDLNTDKEVDRGGPYIELSELTPINSPFLSHQATRNRQEITAILGESRFVAYPYEFWHYSSGDAYEQELLDTGRPARYGAVDYDAATGQVKPIEEPQKPLNSIEEIQAEIQAALDRQLQDES